ncbi:MAG: serine hydrolase [Gemmatimonadota bacterium]|nr:serine hydrolase [Gemmatimonadota bacterium]
MMTLTAAASALPDQNRPASSPPREALERGIAEIFASGAAPGMSVVIVVDTAVLYVGGFGVADVATQRPVTPETIFYIASSTKSFTGLASALLDRAGTLSLDAPLSRYLPGVTLHPPLSADSITIRELLTHTHGIDNDGPIVFRTAYSGEHDPGMLERLLAEHEADERGGAFRYGNIGYNVASLAIDRATGRSWKDVLRSLVLEPAGMRHTTPYVSRTDPSLLAQPYAPADTGFDRIPYAKVDGNLHAAGGLVSTANDMARWLELNLTDGMLDGRQVFPAEIMREVHRLQVRHADSLDRWPRHGYAIGWQVGTYAGDTLLHHFGGFPGFDAHVSFMPQRRIGVAVLANGGFGGGLMDQVSQYIYDVLAGRVDPQAGATARRSELVERITAARGRIATNRAERRARPQQLPHRLEAYTGTYESPSYGRMVWTVEKGRLHARIGALASVAETYDAAANALRVELIPGSGSTVRFAFEGDRAASLTWSGTTFERVETRSSR